MDKFQSLVQALDQLLHTPVVLDLACQHQQQQEFVAQMEPGLGQIQRAMVR